MTDELKSKVRVPDADIVSELVAKGELELGIVVTTQILTTPGVDWVGPLPSEIQYYFQFVGGVSAQSSAPAAARDLLKFFASPTAIPVIKSQGMEPGQVNALSSGRTLPFLESEPSAVRPSRRDVGSWPRRRHSSRSASKATVRRF